jgi:hypothetical protein
MSNAEVATELFISIATAKTYVTRLLAKLCARDRVQLVIIAYEGAWRARSVTDLQADPMGVGSEAVAGAVGET